MHMMSSATLLHVPFYSEMSCSAHVFLFTARVHSQVEERQDLIDAYQAPDSEIFAFLLSTRAGGQGITLTAADTVS